MIGLDIRVLLEGIMSLSHLHQFATEEGIADSAVDGGDLSVKLLSIYENFVACGLPVSAESAFEMAEALAHNCSMKQLSYLTDTFNKVLFWEFSAKSILMLTPERAKYNGPPQKIFGDAICNAFPSTVSDIEEAAKCLAFARGTAGVFHLMRVLEAGLKSVSKSLGIQYAPSWESYIKQIGDRITAKHQTKSIKWKKDEPFFRDLLGDFQAVKLAWRNPTMHIDRRYTPDEAEDVFIASRALMGRLSTRFGERKK